MEPVENPGPQGVVVGLDPEGSMVTGTLDERLGNFLVGPLLDLQGNPILDEGHEADDPDGPPITHTPYINELTPNSWRQAGARIAKYEMEIGLRDRKSTRLNSSHVAISYAVFCLKK